MQKTVDIRLNKKKLLTHIKSLLILSLVGKNSIMSLQASLNLLTAFLIYAERKIVAIQSILWLNLSKLTIKESIVIKVWKMDY